MSDNNTAEPSPIPSITVPSVPPFLLGPAAKKDLRQRLKSSTNPASTIVDFQKTHTLGACLMRGIQPIDSALISNEESFHLEAVLTFLGHLGVSRFEAHSAIRDALHSTLLEDISKAPSSANKNEALLKLLQSAWKYVHIPQVQPILVQIIKSLGQDIPIPVLLELAKRKESHGDSTTDMKYADLLNQLPFDTKRLLWETEWTLSFRGDGTQLNTMAKVEHTLLATNIQPFILQYLTDPKLLLEADLPFVHGVRDKKVATDARRSITLGVMECTTTTTTTTTTTELNHLKTHPLLKKKPNDREMATPTLNSAIAISKLKDAIGNRPKLLSALFNMLITQHGLHPNSLSQPSILGGSSYLTCTLLADLLISYSGQLPKQYETVSILAHTLDTCVKDGIFTDEALLQVQSCLRNLYPTDSSSSSDTTTIQSPTTTSTTTTNIKISLSSAQVDPDIRSIILDSIQQIKECDPSHLFLQPVTDHIAPNYSTVIKKPICIRDMETKTYSSLQDFEADVNLMFQNCLTYNISTEGKWVREEARRQQVIWKEEILKQARMRLEGLKRKETSEVHAASSFPNNHRLDIESKKRKHDVLLAQQELAKERKSGKDLNARNPLLVKVQPLVAFSGKKQKKDLELPSMHALASMLLADPFVVRLLLDKTLRSIKVDVVNDKSTPAEHLTLPSTLQLLHLASLSTKLCGCKGKYLYIPSVGFEPDEKLSGDNHGDRLYHTSPHILLRKHLPLLAKLWIQVSIDRRLTPDGDLATVTYNSSIYVDDWGKFPSQGDIICSLVQGILIDVLYPGSSNDKALLIQIPRLNKVLVQLSWDPNMGRSFYTALISVVLRHKSKMSHLLRDLIVSTWFGWFHRGCMHSPVHEFFVKLLNEWSHLGNILLPKDKLLQLAKETVKITEEKDNCRFSECWNKNEINFTRIKEQYERMLDSVSLEKAGKWKKSIDSDIL